MAVTRRRGSRKIEETIVERRWMGGLRSIAIWMGVVVIWYGWISYWLNSQEQFSGVMKPWLLRLTDLNWERWEYNVLMKPGLRWEVAMVAMMVTYIGVKGLKWLGRRIGNLIPEVKPEKLPNIEWMLEARSPSVLKEFVEGLE